MKKSTCKHDFEFIAESSQSYNEWCRKCGAWKRTPYEEGRTKIYLPEGAS